MRLRIFVAFLCTLALAQERRPPVQEGFRFRAMGPAVGNRIASAAGIPGDPSTYYVGAASGGVWKSTNGGTTWNPIFDSQPVAAIGALAVASSDHKVVWAGTGEAWAIRDVDMTGDGVYKSTDEGKTWTHMGLDATGRIGRIVIHPTNPDVVFVCALGRLTGPQQERGVFRTIERRKELGSRLVRRRQHRLLRLGHGSAQSTRALRRHVASGDAHLRDVQRRTVERRLCFPRWRNEVDAPGRSRPAKIASWQNRCRRCVHRFRSRVRIDSNRRPRFAVAIRRWWGKLDSGQLGARFDWSRRLLHPHRGFAHERKRSAGGEQQLSPVERRRQDIQDRSLGRRHARYLD